MSNRHARICTRGHISIVYHGRKCNRVGPGLSAGVACGCTTFPLEDDDESVYRLAGEKAARDYRIGKTEERRAAWEAERKNGQS